MSRRSLYWVGIVVLILLAVTLTGATFSKDNKPPRAIADVAQPIDEVKLLRAYRATSTTTTSTTKVRPAKSGSGSHKGATKGIAAGEPDLANKPEFAPGVIVWTKDWMALHNCEQPGNWYANGSNPADPYHQVFQGGLGMSTKAWQMAVKAASDRGVTLPNSALAASPEEQMTGAQAFFDKHGDGWGCPLSSI